MLHSLLGVEVGLFWLEFGDREGEDGAEIVASEDGVRKRCFERVSGILTLLCHDIQKRKVAPALTIMRDKRCHNICQANSVFTIKTR